MKNTEMLKKNYEFKNVLERRNYYSGRYIEMFMTKNNKAKNYLGIAVSKKTTNSVNRNKIKRLIRENYRKVEDEIKKGNSFIILWKKNADISDATYRNIEKDMKNIFKKAKMIEEE